MTVFDDFVARLDFFVVVPAWPRQIIVGLLTFITAARDIGTVVLLATGKTRALALLTMDYTAGAELERATVVVCLIVLLVVAGALLAHALGAKFQIRS